jgi:hypothetical protein
VISVSLRALLLYNIGIALVFTIIGSLSTYSLDLMKPNRANDSPVFAKESQLAIEQEPSIDAVRARALYYFGIARDIRRARVADDTRTYYDVRILSFVVAGLFVIGGILALLLAPTKVARMDEGRGQ